MSAPKTDTAAAARQRPLLGGLALGGTAGLVAALLLAVLDGGLAALHASPSAWSAIVLALCLYAPVGVAIGLLLGFLNGGIRAATPSGASGLWAFLRANPRVDQAVAGGIIAAGVCAVLEVVLVHGFGMTAAAAMANRRLASLSTAIVAAGGLVFLALLFFPLLRMARGLTGRIPRRATLVVLVLAALAAAGGGAFVLGGVDWRVLRFAPWLMLGALTLLTLVLIGVQLRRGSGWQKLTTLGLTLVVGGGLGLTAPAMGDRAPAVAAALDGYLLPLLIGAGRALGDRDGDGYSAWFQGGDCDDRNKEIHPGAHDLPGNGIARTARAVTPSRSPRVRRRAARPTRRARASRATCSSSASTRCARTSWA